MAGGGSLHVGSSNFYTDQSPELAGIIFPSSVPAGARFFVNNANQLVVTGITGDVSLVDRTMTSPRPASSPDAPMITSAAVFSLRVGDMSVRVAAIHEPLKAGARIHIENPEEAQRKSCERQAEPRVARQIATAANADNDIKKDLQLLVSYFCKRFKDCNPYSQARIWEVTLMIHPQSQRVIMEDEGATPFNTDSAVIRRLLPEVIEVTVILTENIVTLGNLNPVQVEERPGKLTVTAASPAHEEFARGIDQRLRPMLKSFKLD